MVFSDVRASPAMNPTKGHDLSTKIHPVYHNSFYAFIDALITIRPVKVLKVVRTVFHRPISCKWL